MAADEDDGGQFYQHRAYPIMQWNQKDLTLLAETADGYNESVERSTKVARTIKEFNGNNGPGVCVFQEVRTGGGGKRAVEFIVNYLNEKSKDDSWRYKLSGEVNPQGRRRELYAVLWRHELMGELHADPAENGYRIMTDGFYPKHGRRAAPSESAGLPAASGAAEEKDPSSDDPPKFAGTTIQFAGATIELGTVQESWTTLDRNGDVNLYFDRTPVLFSFSPPTSKFVIHIVVCHAATGGEFKTPYQNMIEAAFVQSICTQAVAQGKYVVLLGDFNTDEDYNQTARIWDAATPLTAQLENDLFATTKQAFLEKFYRGVPSGLPTNMFPFLAGGNAVPKHNDDIWLPDDDEKVRHITFKGKLDGGGRAGVVHKIPDYVLIAWDVKTRAYFDAIGNTKFKSASKHTLNRMLSMTWSDHRPVSVKVSPTPSYVKSHDIDSGSEEGDAESFAIIVLEEKISELKCRDGYDPDELARLEVELVEAVVVYERKLAEIAGAAEQEEDKEEYTISDVELVAQHTVLEMNAAGELAAGVDKATSTKSGKEMVKEVGSETPGKKQAVLTEFFS